MFYTLNQQNFRKCFFFTNLSTLSWRY